MSDHAHDPDAYTLHEGASPDGLTGHSAGAGRWGLPSDEGQAGQAPAALRPPAYDYARGILVGHGEPDADEMQQAAQFILPTRVDAPRSYEMPHEATHRRYEPPIIVPVSQGVAGYTNLLPGRALHFAKLIACFLTLDAAGTIQFVQGPGTGTGEAAMTGALALGGANAPGFVLPPAQLATPWLYSTPDLAFGLITVTGKAAGWAVVAFSPYDQ